jgi:hypothetical protein
MEPDLIRRKAAPVAKYAKYERRPTYFQWGEWNTPARRSSRIELKCIDRFNPRDMRHVYGRAEDYTGEGYSRKHTVELLAKSPGPGERVGIRGILML